MESGSSTAAMPPRYPEEDYEHVITVYGGTDPWEAARGFRDRQKAAYLILARRERQSRLALFGRFR